MKIYVSEDDQTLVYVAQERESPQDVEIEVDESTLLRWFRVEAAYDAVQEEIRESIKHATRNCRCLEIE